MPRHVETFCTSLEDVAGIGPKLLTLILALPDRKADEEICRRVATGTHNMIFNAAMMKHPSVKKGGARTAREELNQLESSMRAVVTILSALHKESREALGPGLREMDRDARNLLRVFIDANDRGHDIIEPARKVPDAYAAAVTQAAAIAFETVTERKAAKITNPDTGEAGGPFLAFLGDIFALAHVDSSTVYQVNQLAKAKHKSSDSKSPINALDDSA